MPWVPLGFSAYFFPSHTRRRASQGAAMKNSTDEMSSSRSSRASIKESWRTCNGTSLTDIIHFISFMSHWKHLLVTIPLPWLALLTAFFFIRSKVEVLWPPCPLHLGPSRVEGETGEAKDPHVMDQKKKQRTEPNDMPCAHNRRIFSTRSCWSWDMRYLHDLHRLLLPFSPLIRERPEKRVVLHHPTRESECHVK